MTRPGRLGAVRGAIHAPRTAQQRTVLELAVALLVPPLIAAAMIPLRTSLAASAGAVIMLAVVAAVALVGRRLSGLVASASAALWFDYFLTRPYERFTISHRPDLETTIALFIVGGVITELAARLHHQRRVADETMTYVQTLHRVAELTANNAPAATVVAETVDMLTHLLALRACRFERTMAVHPLARIGDDGSVTHVDMFWPVESIGIPGPESEIVARWRGRERGRFVLTPTPAQPISRERLIVAVSLVEVAAAALAEREVGS